MSTQEVSRGQYGWAACVLSRWHKTVASKALDLDASAPRARDSSLACGFDADTRE